MCKDVTFEYKGEKYSKEKLQQIIDFYNQMQFKGGDIYCPLCNGDLADNDCFVCEECKKLMPIDTKCFEHVGYQDLCINCCSECEADRQAEKAFEINHDLTDRRTQC